MNIKKMYYPLYIKNSFKRCKLSNNSYLRKISKSEVEQFFGITNRKYNKAGKLSNWTLSKKALYEADNFIDKITANTHFIFDSNYVFVTGVANEDESKIFNQAIKLHLPSKSGLLLGFNKQTPSIKILHPNPFFKKLNYCSIKNGSHLRKIFKKLGTAKNSKISLTLELYQDSLSGNQYKLSHRFLSLMTILEMLLLPNCQHELSYRLSIRLAKLLSSYYKYNPKKIFDLVKNNKNGLYKIRSEIVHEGYSKKLTFDNLQHLINLVKDCLLIYLDNKTYFQNLDKIILEG